MKEHAFRLQNGHDLKIELEKYVLKNNIKAGVILSCVGCLSKAILRNAGGKDCIELNKNLEIVSATGTFSSDGCHIHISVSDEDLKTYGGHLKEGCIINTTAEIVILELESFSFTRKFDNNTGYNELNIEKIWGDLMIELEDNKRKLIELDDKIKSVGDSLWHCFYRKYN